MTNYHLGFKVFSFSLFITICSFAHGQEFSVKQKSSVPDSAAYFIKGKLTSTERLKLIPQDSIKSVKVIKRDTVINDRKYYAQIFVTLIGRKED